MVRRQTSTKRQQPGFTNFIWQLFQSALTIGLIVIVLGLGYFAASYWKQWQEMPDITSLERYEPIEAIQIFDRNDQLVCTVEGDEDRRIVPLNEVSLPMQQAILAAEDHHFYEHHGINYASIFRALLVNLLAGHVKEGGSTITQQLVKNIFFNETGRTLDRKIKEALVAYELEQRYPKEKILQLYLNQVYFGNGSYGIERAAARYFDKSASRLNISEAAFLAGLVKAPSELSANHKLAIERQHEIIDKMVEYGYIMPQQGQIAKSQQLVFKTGINPLQKYPYYVSYVLQLLRERFSQAEMRRQGLRVYTNLDPIAQDLAEQTLNTGISKAPKGVSQGALVSVSVPDGAVIALVGGVGNFWKNQWNRATNPHTAGSSFKPYVYLTAFIKGALRPQSIIADEPLVIKQPWGLPNYCPKNFDHRFLGPIPVKKALALSRNVCSVRIAKLVGIDSVVETARLAGITSKLDANLSLALGSSAISPLEQAGSYATFARGGIAIRPQVIRRIDNNKGQVIESFESHVDKVFEPEPVAELLECMQEVVRIGTGTQARLPDRPVAGKTGTADESKDIWFIGFTPDLVTAVWGGNDENLPIPGTHVTGGDVMAKIWKDYNLAYYVKHPTPPGSFITPEAAENKISKQKEEVKKEELLPAPNISPIDISTDQSKINTNNSIQLNKSFGESNSLPPLPPAPVSKPSLPPVISPTSVNKPAALPPNVLPASQLPPPSPIPNTTGNLR